MYTNIPGRPLEYATTILACIGVLVVVPIYVFYWNGPAIRARSKFATTLAHEREARGVKRVDTVGARARAGELETERGEKGREEGREEKV